MKEEINRLNNDVDRNKRKFLIDSSTLLAGSLLASSIPGGIIRAASRESEKERSIEESLLIASYFNSGNVRTLSLEGDEGDGLNSGILALRKEVMKNEKEVGLTCRIGKDGRCRWEHKIEGEGDHLGRSMEQINFIRDCIKRGDTEEVDLYHTHPFKTSKADLAISSKKSEEIILGKKPMPSVPPSVVDEKGMGDLGVPLFYEVWFKEHIKTKCMAVDAKGVWSYIPDRSHTFINRYVENLTLLSKILLTLIANPINRNLIDMLPQERKSDLPSLIIYLDDSFSIQLGPKMASTVKDASKKWKELFIEFKKERDALYNAIVKFEKDSCHEYYPSLTKLVKAYENLGFIVSFTSFEDIEK